jgi:hypothetical protein
METAQLIQSPSSFRDAAGWIFRKNDIVYRQVNKVYASHYDKLLSSGLYNELVKKNFF